MPGPLDVLINVFELEKQKNFSNTSVSGGMAKFVSFIEKPDVNSLFDSKDIQILESFLISYAELEDADREKGIKRILEWLKDDQEQLKLSISLNKSIILKSKKQSDDIHQDPAFYASVKSIRGIGDRNIRIFKKLGIEQIIDLLRYFPRRYQDYSHLKTIDQVQYGDELSIIGSISQDVFVRDSKSGRLKIIETAISDGTGTLRLNWFNKPFLRNQLRKGMPVVVSGKIDSYLGRLVMTSPEWEPLESDQLHTNRIVPVYPLTAGISQRQLRNVIGHNLGIWVNRIKDYFGEAILESEGLITLNNAIRQIHFPDTTRIPVQSPQEICF